MTLRQQPPSPKLPSSVQPDATDYVNAKHFDSAYDDDGGVLTKPGGGKGKGKAPINTFIDDTPDEYEPTEYARLPDDDGDEEELHDRLPAHSPTSPVLLTPASPSVNGSSGGAAFIQPRQQLPLHVDTTSGTVSDLATMFPDTPVTTIEAVLQRVGESHREEAVDALFKLERERQGSSSNAKSPFDDPDMSNAASSSSRANTRQAASPTSPTPSSPSSPSSPRVRFHESTQPSSPGGITAASYNSAAKGIRILAGKFPDMDRAALATVLASCDNNVEEAEKTIREERMVDATRPRISEDGASQNAAVYLAMNPPGPQEDGLAVLSSFFPNIKVSWLEGVLDSTYGNVPAAAQLVSVYEEERLRGSLPRRGQNGQNVSAYLASREKKDKDKKEGSKWKLWKKDDKTAKRASVPPSMPFMGRKDSEKGTYAQLGAASPLSLPSPPQAPPIPPNPEVRAQAIENLSAMFPDASSDSIGGVLDSVNGRVDQALEILLRNQTEEEQRQAGGSAQTPPRQRREHAEV